MSRKFLPVLLPLLLLTLFGASHVAACGGLFCQNIPVDQQAERIIFTVNDDDTVSAYVQINYVGSAMDFSWVVPVPSVPQVDVAEVASFDELSRLTAPVFIPPPMSPCIAFADNEVDRAMTAPASGEFRSDVTVLAQGTAGPYGFDVVTSENPDALITWLREHNYQITEPMEPLVRAYTDEGFNFLAMRLQPDQGVQAIQPVVMTYEASAPMIPIRLTAVAATPNMSILTWVFADAQVVPENYAHPQIDDGDIRADFSQSNGTNYLGVLDQTVDRFDGRAFITEYAKTSTDFLVESRPSDPLVIELTRKYDYVTRLFGRMSPEEMTVDPTFKIENRMRDVSNIHDLSNVDPATYYGCQTASSSDIGGAPISNAPIVMSLMLVVGIAWQALSRRRD